MKITSNPIAQYTLNSDMNARNRSEQTDSSPVFKIEDTVELSSAALRTGDGHTVLPPVDEPIDV